MLDDIKAMGYKYSTRAAMTVSISDMTVPPEKPDLIQKAQDTVDKITRNYKRGLITEEERYKEVVETWKETDAVLTKALLDGLKGHTAFRTKEDAEKFSIAQKEKRAAVKAAHLEEKENV